MSVVVDVKVQMATLGNLVVVSIPQRLYCTVLICTCPDRVQVECSNKLPRCPDKKEVLGRPVDVVILLTHHQHSRNSRQFRHFGHFRHLLATPGATNLFSTSCY